MQPVTAQYDGSVTFIKKDLQDSRKRSRVGEREKVIMNTSIEGPCTNKAT